MTILNMLVINTKWQFHSCHFFLCIKENFCNRYAHIPITSPTTQTTAATPVFPDLSSRLSSTAASPRRPAPRFPPVSVPVSLPVKPFLSSVPRPLPFCRLPSSAVFLFPFVQALSRLPSPVSSVLSASFQYRFPFPLRSSLFPPSVFCLFPFYLPNFPFGYLLIYLPPPQPSGYPDAFRHGYRLESISTGPIESKSDRCRRGAAAESKGNEKAWKNGKREGEKGGAEPEDKRRVRRRWSRGYKGRTYNRISLTNNIRGAILESNKCFIFLLPEGKKGALWSTED